MPANSTAATTTAATAPPIAPLQVLFGEMWFMNRPRPMSLPATYAPLSTVQTVSNRKSTSIRPVSNGRPKSSPSRCRGRQPHESRGERQQAWIKAGESGADPRSETIGRILLPERLDRGQENDKRNSRRDDGPCGGKPIVADDPCECDHCGRGHDDGQPQRRVETGLPNKERRLVRGEAPQAAQARSSAMAGRARRGRRRP